MENIREVMELTLMGILLIGLGGVVTITLVALNRAAGQVGGDGEKLQQGIQRQFDRVDHALAPVGRTATGEFVYGRIEDARQELSNPASQTVQNVVKLVDKILPVTDELIDDETVAAAFDSVLTPMRDLFDGISNFERREATEGHG